MTYSKPEVAVLGEAAELIQGFKGAPHEADPSKGQADLFELD